MQKKVNLGTLIASIIIAIIVTFTVTFTIVQVANQLIDYADEKENASSVIDMWQSYLPEDKQNLELFEALAIVDYFYQSDYVSDIDKQELIYYLMNSYIACVGDPYGAYYTPEQVESVFGELDGKNVGIGVYVKSYKAGDPGIKVLEVMKDSPAEKAGVKKGDIITHVNGEAVSTLGYDGAVSKIAGAIGSVVTIKVIRDGNTVPITITRAEFIAQSVFSRKYELDNTVGVIRILEFNSETPRQFKEAVNTLLDGGCKSLVFDVRSNPGGTLDSCLEILDFLLPEGEIVKITELDGTVVDTYYSSEGEIDVPMAVLTDGATASAGELFTCALRDYEKAIVVGTKTYGKGCMQNIFSLPNGGALRITTQLYDPPKSENYDGVGIIPDVVVELDGSLKEMNYFEITDAMDNQLSAAYEALVPKQ